jgi:cytochrome b involved in lipid metabolism
MNEKVNHQIRDRIKEQINTHNRIIVQIEGEWYDVTDFKHPGEGIRGTYMRDYNGKSIDKEFEHYHYTDKAHEIIFKVNQKGEYKRIKKINL